MADAAATAEHYAKSNIWLTAMVVTLPTFMVVLSTSVANVILPHIAGSLSASVEDSTWVLSSYLIANAIAIPVAGWLGSVFGRRNYFVFCSLGFGLASLLCGLAPSLGWLVVFRVLQGLFGGGLQPVTQAILVDTFPPKRRAMGMAVYGLTVIIAPIAGPIAGGWVVDEYSWRWVFLANVPIGVVAAFLTWRLIADPPFLRRRTGAEVRFDGVGFAFLCLGLGCLQLTLDLGERSGWFMADHIVLLSIAAGLGLIWFVLWELRQHDPLVNLRLLRNRDFAIASGVMFLYGLVLYSTTAILPLFAQSILGYNAMLSGAVLAPSGLATMVVMPVVGLLEQRIDARWLMASGFLIIAISLVLMGGFTATVDFRHVAMARALQGLGFGLTFVPINTVAYAFVPKEARSDASCLLNLVRNVGAGIGIALSMAMVTHAAETHRVVMLAHLTPYDHAYQQSLAGMTALYRQASGDASLAALAAQAAVSHVAAFQAHMLAYRDQFRWLALGVFLTLPLTVLMRSSRRQAVPSA